MRRTWQAAGGCALACLLGGCAATGRATLAGTAPGSPLTGAVRLQEAAGGLRVTAQVRHAPPGRHGFHIHEGSSCAEAGQAAGGHFNPDAAPHGDLRRSGVRGAHAGDLGNLEVGPDGRGAYAALLPGLALAEGPRAVAGRAIILHADADDLSSQPTGNAGGRIGCGLIERAR